MEKQVVTATTQNTTKGANFATETTGIWNSYNFEMETQEPNVLNYDSDKLTSSFFNQNWDTSMDQGDPFESALSSIVSSPVASNTPVFRTDSNGVGDTVMIRELIGRLGNISGSSSGDVSPPMSYTYNSRARTTNNASGYSTPLNSPPKLNLSMMGSQIRGNVPTLGGSMVSHPSLAPFQGNQGFAERAAMYSCFASRNLAYGGLNGQLGNTTMPRIVVPEKAAGVVRNQTVDAVNASQVNSVQESCKTLLRGKNLEPDGKLSKFPGTLVQENSEFGDSREGSSVSEQIPGGESSLKPQNDGNSRKRKPIPRGKVKEAPSSSEANKATAEENEPNVKRSKQDDVNEEPRDGNQKQNNDKGDSKQPEPPKDYIHVRARRGQATDSHSLAERVRREKISERMKFLQDLVPGCNKVTGKAVMLDEIINYVQSLQRQVEFLSMKLANLNPRLDFNTESLLSKDTLRLRGVMPHPLDSSVGAFSYGYQTLPGFSFNSEIPGNNTDTQFSVVNLHRDSSIHLPPLNDGLSDVSGQVTTFWDEDLQSVVQMGFGTNQKQNFLGSIPSNQMKIEE